ncbi:MAG: DUF3047 domain-containing protein [Casimicrobium sp.]
MANFAKILLATGSFLLPTIVSVAMAADVVAPSAAAIPRFSSKAPGTSPQEWSFQPVRSAKQFTRYAFVRDDELGTTVLEAVADAAAGALTYRFDGDARASAMLRFKWKPGNLIATSDPRSKAFDDYVARIYITFATDPEHASVKERAENAIAHALYGETPPHAALAYVFTHKAALGTIITSPYTQRVKSIVVDADPAAIGKWKSFARDIYDDYKRAFGEEPPRISGIAIMVDTDNTGEKASARFGDITLSAKP